MKNDAVLGFFASRIASGILGLAATELPVDLVLLTGGLARDRDLCRAIWRKIPLPVPVVRVPGSVESQALAAGQLRASARPRSLVPYKTARDALAARRQEEDRLLETPVFSKPLLWQRQAGPMTSADDIIAAAGATRELLTVAIVGADNVEAMLAAKLAAEHGGGRLARFVLLGPYARISQLAWELDVPLDGDGFILVDTDEPAAHAVSLLEAGMADTLMKGSVTTADLLRAYLQLVKGQSTAGRPPLISHVSLLDIPGRAKLVGLTDAAINPSPDLDARIQILDNAVAVLHAIGIRRPKVAVISATEKASAKVVSSVEGKEIASRVAGRDDLIIEGPISVDIALSPESAAEKSYEGKIRGDADLLLVPNIDVGNALYKSFTLGRGTTVAGAVVGGAVPLILTSRGDSARSKLASLALALVVADRARGGAEPGSSGEP
jgi:phosphotransacetylase